MNTIVQVSTIGSFAAGNFDAMGKFSEFPAECNFGIGCYENLDGEMILIDGKYYQLKADGIAYEREREAATPFSTVAIFEPTDSMNVEKPLTFSEFKVFIESKFPDNNIPLLFRFEGEFEAINYRSIPAQERPFPTLAEAVKHQTTFTREHVKGSLIGFRFPKYFNTMNLPGYHIHFIDEKRREGGHVLDVTVSKGKLSLAESFDFRLQLPRNVEAYRKTDMEPGHPPKKL
jgi:acetolactate decarboxylase